MIVVQFSDAPLVDATQLQQENRTLMGVLIGIHEMLNEAGVPLEGDLTERVQTLIVQRDDSSSRRRQWKAAAKAFRRRWRDACTEIDDYLIADEDLDRYHEQVAERERDLATLRELVKKLAQADGGVA